MRKKFLEKRLLKLQTKIADLKARALKSDDINEVRSINEKIEELNDDIADVQEELNSLASDSDGDGSNEIERQSVPENAEFRGGTPLASYGQTPTPSATTQRTDVFDSVEYRQAFMEYVCRGVAIPNQFRDNAITTTGDASAVIPTTYMSEIIRELSTYGNIYAKVRKLNVQGAIEYPLLTLVPTASWIGETTTSDSQKIQVNTTISFKYFGVECKVAQSLLCNVTTLETFQQLFVPLATEAIVRAVEQAIFNGDGTVQPLGILNDTRVPKANVIELTEAEFSSWETWHKKVFAKMKKSYRTGEFVMNQSTWDWIDGMVDSAGQPIARVNYGIADGETYRFGGKSVETVEDDLLPSWEDAQSGDVVAVFIRWDYYAINSNLSMTVNKWQDYDTNEIKNKVIMILDGKLLDANGVLIIKKKVA